MARRCVSYHFTDPATNIQKIVFRVAIVLDQPFYGIVKNFCKITKNNTFPGPFWDTGIVWMLFSVKRFTGLIPPSFKKSTKSWPFICIFHFPASVLLTSRVAPAVAWGFVLIFFFVSSRGPV